MKSIKVTRCAATNTLPARIKVRAHKLLRTYPLALCEMSDERNPEKSAIHKFCSEMNWHGYLVPGGDIDGESIVYVFLPRIGGKIEVDQLIKVGDCHPLQ